MVELAYPSLNICLKAAPANRWDERLRQRDERRGAEFPVTIEVI